MTRDELIQLAGRLRHGPVPTPQKKVYAYEGDAQTLLAAVPPAITVGTRVTDACERNTLPAQGEKIPAYLRDRLAEHLRNLQSGRNTSIILVHEAALLAKYRVPLSFLYDLTGDAHAVILLLEAGVHPNTWTFPSYVHYDPGAPASYLEQALGGQFIREGRGEEERL